MDAIEMYHYSLQQEVLDETISNELNRLIVYMCNNNLSVKDETEYSELSTEIFAFKKGIISDANNDDKAIQDITNQIQIYRKRIKKLIK